MPKLNRQVPYFLLLLLAGCGNPTQTPVSPSSNTSNTSNTSSPVTVLPCPAPAKAPAPTSYQQRDGNRCEGLQPEPASAPGPKLKSLIVGSLPKDWSAPSIALRIPQAKPNDRIELEFPTKGYLIDRFATRFGPDGFRFDQPTTWLKKANDPDINPQDLTARAEQVIQNQPVYLPVILGQPRDSTYQFKIKFGGSVTVTRQEIRYQGKEVQSNPGPSLEISPDNLLEHTWKPRPSDPAGTYTLAIVPAGGEPMQFQFQYDPAWFK